MGEFEARRLGGLSHGADRPTSFSPVVRNAEAAVEKTKLKAQNGKLTAVTEVSNNVQPPTHPRTRVGRLRLLRRPVPPALRAGRGGAPGRGRPAGAGGGRGWKRLAPRPPRGARARGVGG